MPLNRTADVNVRMRPNEREACDRAAELEGLRLSEWVRRVLIAAAQRRLARVDSSER